MISTVRRRPDRLRAVLALGLAFCTGVGLLLSGCGGARTRAPAATPGSIITPEDRERADRLFVQLQHEEDLHRDRAALSLAYELIDHYPAYPRRDETLLIAARCNARLGDPKQGLRLADRLLAEYPDSPFRVAALDAGADMAVAAGDTFAAAGMLVEWHDLQTGTSARKQAADRAAVLLQRLGPDQLGQLETRFPDSDLRPYIGFLHVQRLVEAGRQEDAAVSLQALHDAAPDSQWLKAASELLGNPDYALRAPAPLRAAGEVVPHRIGILVPLTGRYAVLGNAFYDGALLAVAEMNRMGWRRFELVAEDTEGDPVGAILGARRLINEQGVMAIVGALLSNTTATAAVVADVYGVPLVSPTATNDRIGAVGPSVFQTNVTGMYETRLMAQLATTLLLKHRIAILYPDTREGARNFQIFGEEVRNLGGEVVAAASFPATTTDFRDPLKSLRKGRPEVVFVDASVDQMILLGPQLDFYHTGALVMGLSNWNSMRLAREAGSVLERAVFPSDTALFPAQWTQRFLEQWRPERLPDEATPLAQKAFQATLLVMDTIARDDILKRERLSEALRARLEVSHPDDLKPLAFASAVRMFSDGQIVSFPGELFEATWVDTVRAAPVDSTLLAPSIELDEQM